VYQAPNSINNKYVTFQISYTINYPTIDATMGPIQISNLIATINANSICTNTSQLNLSSVEQLIIDYCNNNGCMADPLCSTTCTPANYFGQTNNTNLCCNSNSCQQGYLQYCNNTNNFTNPTCQNFYANSYTNNQMSPCVQSFLTNQCTQQCTSGSSATSVNETISTNLADVCGCFLPQSVYTAFENQVTQADPSINSVVFNEPQCYYPMCTNATILKLLNYTCPSNNIITCINNNYTTLNAGGNIVNTNLTNEEIDQCQITNNSPSSSPASSSPSSSPSSSSPSSPTPSPSPNSTSVPSNSSLNTNQSSSITLYILIGFAGLLFIIFIIAIVYYKKKKSKK
jgi:hypothetical protein